MKKENSNFLILMFFMQFLFPFNHGESCIAGFDRDIERNQFTFPEFVQSENFIVHFTSSDVDSQFVNGQWLNLQCNEGYALSVLNHAESALSEFLDDGWEDIPPDCDESIQDVNSPEHCINFGGNSLYDIYLSNDGVGMVVPETPYPVEPYTGGYTSFMKVSTLLNQHESVPYWNFHVIAHELHHSIQLRYGYSVSGEPGDYMYNGWFFEQSATYMENVIYPDSNHLTTMLGNCNVVTPLTFPHYNIDYPSEIYPYRSALWQNFLVESIGDPSIVRYMWENYGLSYATGEAVSLFPIYDNAIQLASNNQKDLGDCYNDYAIWRYFTGDRTVSNEYFSRSLSYCEAATVSDFENEFVIQSNKGASTFIELPDGEDIVFSSQNTDDIQLSFITIDSGNNINIDYFELQDTISNFQTEPDAENILIVSSTYNGIDSYDLNYYISLNSSNPMGDINGDFEINVQDAILMVNMALNGFYNEFADFNLDSQVDILDIVFLINIIIL